MSNWKALTASFIAGFVSNSLIKNTSIEVSNLQNESKKQKLDNKRQHSKELRQHSKEAQNAVTTIELMMNVFKHTLEELGLFSEEEKEIIRKVFKKIDYYTLMKVIKNLKHSSAPVDDSVIRRAATHLDYVLIDLLEESPTRINYSNHPESTFDFITTMIHESINNIKKSSNPKFLDNLYNYIPQIDKLITEWEESKPESYTRILRIATYVIQQSKFNG